MKLSEKEALLQKEQELQQTMQEQASLIYCVAIEYPFDVYGFYFIIFWFVTAWW